MEEHKDFLASELLHELKLENERKDRQLVGLRKILIGTVVGALCAILLTVGVFIWYLNQYDFESTSTQIASGVYAVVDSDGNIIASDLTPEDIQQCLEVIEANGGSVYYEVPEED